MFFFFWSQYFKGILDKKKIICLLDYWGKPSNTLMSNRIKIHSELSFPSASYKHLYTVCVLYRFFIIRHIHNHTSIISSEMQVELKKNTA